MIRWDLTGPITWDTIAITWDAVAISADVSFDLNAQYTADFDATKRTWEGVALYDTGLGYTARPPVYMRALAPFPSNLYYIPRATFSISHDVSFDLDASINAGGFFTFLGESFFSVGARMNSDQELMWNGAPGTNATNWDEQTDPDTIWSKAPKVTNTWNKVDYPN